MLEGCELTVEVVKFHLNSKHIFLIQQYTDHYLFLPVIPEDLFEGSLSQNIDLCLSHFLCNVAKVLKAFFT